MDNDYNPLYIDPTQEVNNPLYPEEGLLSDSPVLDLSIEDEDLVKNLTTRIDRSRRWFEQHYNLTARRKKNEMYLFGRQVDQKEADGKLKDYETRSSDNALYEIEASLKPLAMSKLPDIIITAGGSDEERKKAALDLTKAIDNQNKQREQREVLGLGFKHLPVYFTAVMKAVWDPNEGKNGQEKFVIINPEYIIVDHTANCRDVDKMSFIAEIVPMTVQEMIMKFPKKKQQIIAKMRESGVLLSLDGDLRDDELASEVKIWETHFDWYKKKKKEDIGVPQEGFPDETPEWETVAAVMWKYEDLLLGKMLDPNFDHEGHDVMYVYDVPGDESTKHEVKPEEVFMSELMGVPMPNISVERVYNNYFFRPHKPYYFFGYDQWGKIPYDETSRIEQNIRNQENLDDQNKTILDQLKTRVKHIWSKESGLKSADIQRLDMDNPKLDVLVEGQVNNVHKEVQPERPDAAQFNALGDTRSRMYAISGSSAVRGQIQSDTATTNQIAREADFTRSDDLVEDTINAACEWMSEWRVHFIKLRYSEDHFVDIVGSQGSETSIKLRRDLVQEGMKVMVKASSTDKLKAQRNAMETAGLGAPFTNPLDFFQDMDMNDAEGRTQRGLLFSLDPQGYYVKYGMSINGGQEMAQALTQQDAAANAQMGGRVQPEATTVPPTGPTPEDTTQVATTPPMIPQGSPRTL